MAQGGDRWDGGTDRHMEILTETAEGMEKGRKKKRGMVSGGLSSQRDASNHPSCWSVLEHETKSLLRETMEKDTSL